MGREVRKVPANWQHPKDDEGRFIPLLDGADGRFASADAEWNEGFAKWREGLCRGYRDREWKPIDPKYASLRWTDYSGSRPSPDDYMPDWPESERTHLMMYEDTTKGTPISPAFETPEELARWLVDNNASANGGQGASYEGWLRVANGGLAPSMVMIGGVIKSGVDL